MVETKLPLALRLEEKDGYFYFLGAYWDYIRNIKRAKFKWDRKERVFKIKKTLENIDRIRDNFIFGKELILEIKNNKRKEYLLKKRYPFLYDFQRKGILIGLKRDAMLLDDMGLGKTLISLVIKDFTAKRSKALILAPKSLLFQWEKEIRERINEDSIIISSKNQEYFRSKFTICNYERILRDYGKIRFPKKFFLICDEVTKFKNPETDVYHLVLKVRAKASKTLFLTGTPIENNILDIYYLSKLLYPFSLSEKEFDERFIRHFPVFGFGYPRLRTIGYKNMDDFTKYIYSFSIRRKKDEVLEDLPELFETERNIDLTPEQRRVKDVVVSEAKRLGSFGVLQSLRLVASDLRLLELSESSFLRNIKIKAKVNPKVEEVKNIVNESRGKIIIFTQFARMAKILHNEIPDSEVIYGDVSKDEREGRINNFRRNKRILISTDTLAYGMNLQFADILINFDLPWNPAILKQRIARIYRIGSKNNKLIINLISSEIDEDVLEVLSYKRRIFDLIVNGESIEDTSLRELLMKKFFES